MSLTELERLATLEANYSHVAESLDKGEERMEAIECKIDKLIKRSPWRAFAASLGAAIPLCYVVFRVMGS